MNTYRIFMVGSLGTIWDAHLVGCIPDDRIFTTVESASEYLADTKNVLRNEVYVILPIVDLKG